MNKLTYPSQEKRRLYDGTEKKDVGQSESAREEQDDVFLVLMNLLLLVYILK